MSAPALRDRSRPPASPPEPSASGRRCDTGRPASSPDSSTFSAARTVAALRPAARRLRPVLAAALLALPLLAVLPTGAEAQTVECTTANTDGSYDVPFGWALKPSGLAAGTKFRLLFITSTSRDGTATDIATYNTFVQTAAKAGHSAISDSCGNKFKVVGSTSSVDARVNTDSESTDTGALIYWLNGDKAADNYGDFYDGGWDSTSATDESGSFNNGINVWTGSNSDGTKSSYYLGRATPPLVRHGSRTGTPLSHGNNSRTSISPFYALSPVFTVGAAPTLSITAPADAAEGDADTRDLTFTVTLSEPVSSPVAYQVCFSGTATADLTGAATIPASADYQPTSVGPLHSPQSSKCIIGAVQAGQVTSKHVGIRIKGDTEAEFDESVIATLSFAGTTPAGVELGTSEATHWIRDDDGAALTLRYGAGRANAPEGSTTGYGEFYLYPFNRALGSGETVTVPLSFTGGTLGTDFTLSVDPNHGFASAVLSGSTVTITGPGPRRLLKLRVVAPDDVDTTDETVTLGVGAATSTVGTVRPDKQGNAQVTLYDDDVSQSLTVEFARSALTVDEPDGPSEPVVRLSEVPRSDIAIPVTVSDGTAVRGEDYTSAAARTVTFPAGRDATQILDITIIDDADYEPVDETFTIAIDTASLPAGVTAKAGGNLQATVTIVSEDPEADPISDSDFLVLGTFEELQYEEHDRRGPDFAVHRLRKANNGTIPDAWGFRLCFAGTATWGADYRVTARNGRVLTLDGNGCTARNSAAYGTAVPAGSDRSWFSVEPIDDAHEDSGETIVISVSKPYNTNLFGGGQLRGGELVEPRVSYGRDSLTFVILNHEIVEHAKAEPAVQVSAGTGGTEGEAVQFTLQAVPAPASPFDVTLTVSQDGDHVAAKDLGSRTVTVPVSGTVTVSVPTVDDDADELAGTVTAALEAGSGYTLGATSSLAVEVADNDETAAPSPTVSECVSDELMATAKRLYERNRHKPPHHAENWFSVLVAFGERTPDQWTADGRTIAPMTAASARQRGWKRFGDALACLEGTGTAGAAPGVYLYATPPGDVSEAGGRKTLTVFLGRALKEGEALRVPLAFGGAATLGSDYTLSAQNPAPQGVTHANLAGPGAPTLTFTGPSASTAKLLLTAAADSVNEGSGETVTVGLGTISAAGFHGAAAGDGAVSFTILEPPPEVSITAKTASITEGADAAFTVRANRAPEADLAVKLAVSESNGSDFVAAGDEGAATVTIPKGETEAAFTVATVDDAADEPDGSVTATLAGNGAGYTVAASPGDAASVKVADNDAGPALPMLSVDDATAQEKDRLIRFTVRLSKAAGKPVWVGYRTRHSTPVSARQYEDYVALGSGLRFGPTETEQEVLIYVFDDSHDEGAETFELVLESQTEGVGVADGVAVGTIVNSDPMPAAWLARFGRTVAEQALDGIAGRMAAPRTPGARGVVAGQAISYDPEKSGNGSGGSGGPGGAANENMAAGGIGLSGNGLSGLAGFDGRAGGFGPGFGAGGPGHAHGFSSGSPQSRTMTMQEALLGSSFTATGAKDGAGGSLAFWGRAAQGSFDGREGAFSLDGDATTAMLGADYARGNWLVGMALMQSAGEGGYADTDPRPHATSRALAQMCKDAEDTEPARQRACNGAVREGDGKVEASLTAAVPYAALQASERLKLWGAAGYGTGEVTLKPQMGGSYRADIDWTMAAAGLRGDVIAPPKEGSGPALAVTSDALWARTSSDKSQDLAASESDVTRLRLGLEGSYRVALEEGGHLTPKLEVGARHDGGDAETGFGVELGGGIAWVDPRLGLSLDLSGRSLIAHGNDDLEDRGFAASLAYRPDPATNRGPSFALRQDWGGRAQGGLDALFTPASLEDRTTGGEATSRWTMEAAYGLPVLGGRFTASPHAGLGLSGTLRDYTLGWRLTPEAASAPDVSFGLKATRRESDAQAPEHSVGVEVRARW